jgi:hypothetical protein
VKILCACEESQSVTMAFREHGHQAYSCDLKPCSGGHPEWHHQGDVRDILQGDWDMCIAFPECTHLAVSGAAHFEKKREDGRQQEGIDFFMLFTDLPHIPKTCIENPVGIMSSLYREPDQIVQPYYFGDQANKTTCFWLKGLPPLVHIPPGDMFDEATHCEPDESITMGSGKKMSKWFYETSCLPQSERAHARSKFWPGISRAMAEQWGEL